MRSSKADQAKRKTIKPAKYGGGDESPPKISQKRASSRSPARTRRASPQSAPSPSRRSPSRKSPSRKPQSKFPARKSPSRATKRLDEDRSPSKRPSIKTNIVINAEPIETVDLTETLRPSRSRRSEYSIKDLTVDVKQIETSTFNDRLNGLNKDKFVLKEQKISKDDFIPRRSSRLQEVALTQAEKDSTSSRSPSKKSVTITDEENSEDESRPAFRKSSSRKLITPLPDISFSRLLGSEDAEFGGRIGSFLLIFLIPITIFYILASCTAANCSLGKIPDLTAYKNVTSWFSISALSLYGAHVLIQISLFYIPIGRLVEPFDDYEKTFRDNSWINVIVTLVCIFVLHYLNIISHLTILNEFFRLAVIAYFFGLIVSVVCFWRTSRRGSDCDNLYGNTGGMIYDFWAGREINPVILKRLNVKLLLRRISLFNALILTSLVFSNSINLTSVPTKLTDIEEVKQVLPTLVKNPTLFTFSLFQVIYLLDLIFNERLFVSTFTWQYEGLGYMYAICISLYPFFFTSICRNIWQNNIQISNVYLVCSMLLFALSFIIYKYSNRIKYEFRRSPQQQELKYVEAMPTFHGKRLLLSALWGSIRHPNYLADILLHIILIIPALLSKSVPVLVTLITVITLVHRVSRDNVRCHKRYTSAWQRYRTRVPSALIPKVF